MASIIKADTLQSTTANVFILNSSGTEYARFDATGVFQLTNPTTFSAGTAALPALTTTGDTNTGIFFPAADTIAFAEGGAEAVRINSSGFVGIGTSSPAFKLDVSGNIRGLINNTSVGNASSAQFTQNGTGDAAISFLIGATTEWLVGVDNSDSDKFKINNITGGGDFNGTGIAIDSAGRVTTPSQPSFACRGFSNLNNGIKLFTNISSNIGGHYNNSTGRFTAPITGLYYISAAYLVNQGYVNIQFGIQVNGIDYTEMKTGSAGGVMTVAWSGVVSLAANDFVQFNYASGSSAAIGLNDQFGQFSGCLLG